MKKLESETFDLIDENFGTARTIQSQFFINREGKKLLSHLGYSLEDKERYYFSIKLLHEYSAIIRELVKQEMLNEMRDRINNIDTFYN